MELLVANGWTQVGPRDTPFSLIVSDQSAGQSLVAVNTSFTRRKELAFSGGVNCPIAIDHAESHVYFSADGVKSLSLGRGDLQSFEIEDGLYAVWMLECVPDKRALLMHLHGYAPKQKYMARLDLESGRVQKTELPVDAHFPLAVNHTCNKALYSTARGVTLYDFSGAIRADATIEFPSHVLGGVFDQGGSRAVFGCNGIVGWHIETGEVSRLSNTGAYPTFDQNGGLWFAIQDGAIAKLRGHDTSFDVIVQLTGMDISDMSYAQPIVFSPDGRYGLARLTGRTRLVGQELTEAEDFAKRVGQRMSDSDRHRYHH
jgi:hypothetical protein